MTDAREERRAFLLKACAVAGSMLAVGVVRQAVAAEQEGKEMQMGQGGTDGYVMHSNVTQRCATCEFWGGPRRLAQDGKTITITGLGWCNNPQSANYLKMTSPEHGPMAVWKKWQLIR